MFIATNTYYRPRHRNKSCPGAVVQAAGPSELERIAPAANDTIMAAGYFSIGIQAPSLLSATRRDGECSHRKPLMGVESGVRVGIWSSYMKLAMIIPRVDPMSEAQPRPEAVD
jgi:hypothetical protein